MQKKYQSFYYTGIIFFCFIFFLVSGTCTAPWRKEIQEAELYDVDFSRVDDGKYTGQHEYRGYTYIVEAQVKNHKITAIEMIDWEENDTRRKALKIFDRVKQDQSLCVDAISGATTASKLYLLCLEDAFPYHKNSKCPAWEYE